ncbi:hypothetical protein KSP40_PGU007950 [Platanthera guangdongensis]|uniref:Amino acid transporter transmembrane domain-containing protein n=1 Tax=Platanthera guangdongensis TaxID=2320717 RepID=A0ABR2M0G7_9ASPA
MKTKEQLGPDRGFEFETDDEENPARRQPDGSSSSSFSSSSSVSSSSGDNSRGSISTTDCCGMPQGSYEPSWPQSYRQSIDLLSSVLSPGAGFLAGSSLLQLGNSFRGGSTAGDDYNHSQLAKPLIPHPLPSTGAHTSSIVSPHSKPASFFYPSVLPPPPRCSTSQAIVNGLNVLCGVGILTTPYAIKEGGWMGLILLVFLGFISFYTGILLKRCLDISPELQTYPDIGQAAFGAPGRLCIAIVLYLELYASCVEYIILVSDSLSSIFPSSHANLLGIDLSCNQLFALTAALAILPTVWLRDLNLLSFLSAGGVIASILMVLCLFWDGVVDGVGFHQEGTVLNLTNLPVALGMFSFCYSGHSVFPNIYSSMTEQSQFSDVLLVCFILCTSIYAAVAAAGFLMFGESIQSQFTLNMPHRFMSSRIAIWATVVNPLTKYALTMTPVALSLEELLPSKHQSIFVAVVIRTLLVISTLVVALLIPFFGFLMALLGSFFTMLVALILPCLCYLSIQRQSVTIWEV